MNDLKLKIVFFGTPQYTIPIWEALLNAGYDIVAVITVPDEQTGGKKIVASPPVKMFALKNHLKLFQPEKLKDNNELVSYLLALAPDLGIVAAYGKIIPKIFLDVPKYGFINVHPSLLPKYRGPSPIKTAILNGDKEIGVTIMLVDEEMDHGKIIASGKYLVSNNKYHTEIQKEIWELGTKLLIEILPKYISGEIKPQEQDHDQATFTKKFLREDGRINWFRSAEEIYNQIRALNPEPGTWSIWPFFAKATEGKKNKTLNIKQAEYLSCDVGQANDHMPGMVIKVDNQIAVVTGKCYLILKLIQLEGGKEMTAKNFLNGHSAFLGSKLE